MSSPALSPILSITEHGQPVRPGWYECFWFASMHSLGRRYFDGELWRWEKGGKVIRNFGD